MPEDRGPGEGRTEEFKGGLAVSGPLELLILSSEGSEGSDDLRIVVNESSIEIGESEE